MDRKLRYALTIAVKIAIGSSLAVLIADFLGLEYAASAGTVTLLTLMNTKWDSLRLAVRRLITYGISMVIGLAVFYLVPIDWLSFGIYILFTVFLAYALGWASTISVNAVIGTHLLLDGKFGIQDMLNELTLVLIGIVIAIILNLFNNYEYQRRSIISGMRWVEGELQQLLLLLSLALTSGEVPQEMDERFEALRLRLRTETQAAYDYQDNTFHSHPVYYIHYFEMRTKQYDRLISIRDNIRKCPGIPARAGEVAGFLSDVAAGVTEMNDPASLIGQLDDVFARMREDTPPETPDEFERRTILYHILLEMDRFLKLKQDFVDGLSEREIREYRSGK